jgi:multidrug resistance efflux pump
MSLKKAIWLNVLILVVIFAAGLIGFYYYNQASTYLKTDNAAIDGKQIVIASPTSGKLTDWTGTEGSNFYKGNTLGDVAIASGSKVSNVAISTPADVTVVKDEATPDSLVAAGTPLAYGYDLNNVWVTANIKETSIDDVKVGHKVDIYVDQVKGVAFEGKVVSIGDAAESVFSLLPSGNADGNYTKVAQVVPVKISINNHKGYELRPGTNVTVRIHR